MKRAYADLDDLSSSSPKRPRKATRHTSTLAVQDPSSQTSKGSSPSTVVASPPAPSPTTSSLEDSGSNDTTSEPGSDSSTSSQSDSGSSNTFSSESEFFQRPVGRDPNDSQSLDYDSVVESSESEIGRLEREDYELKRSLGLDPHEHREVLSVLDHRLINWDTESTSTKSGSDSASNAESFSSTSASISDDVSQASSSSVPADNDSNPSSSSGSSSSSSSNPAPASSNPNSTSSSSPSPSPTTLPPSQLSTSNLSSLQSRLQTLLPQLKSANQELEVEKTAGTLGERDIEKVEEDEGERYIEMELGLGVLEQRGEEYKQADDEGGEGDVLGRMMGKKGKRKGRRSRKVGIEEIGG